MDGKRVSLTQVPPVEMLDKNDAEQKDLDMQATIDGNFEGARSLPGQLDKIAEQDSSLGTSKCSPHVGYWRYVATSPDDADLSSEEDFDCPSLKCHAKDSVEVIDLEEGKSEGAGDRIVRKQIIDLDKLDDDDSFEDISPREEPSAANLNSWLTTVGPIKNTDSDPTDLRRVVDYGPMKEAEKVTVTQGSAPVHLHRTLGDIDQKRQSLTQVVRNASRRLTSTTSLPYDLGRWVPHTRKSASSLFGRGRTLLRNTGNLFRSRKNRKTYYTCHETDGNTQDDTLSEFVPAGCGNPVTTSVSGILSINDGIQGIAIQPQSSEASSKDNNEPTTDSKMQYLKRMIFRKVKSNQ